MLTPTKFAVSGLASYLAIGLGIVSAALSALIQPSVKDRGSIWFVLVAIAVGFVAGWIALNYGRQLKCEKCQSNLLPVDSFGFQGLRVGPVLRALWGQLRCPACAERPNRGAVEPAHETEGDH